MTSTQANDPESLYRMGLLYLEGTGVPRDLTQAIIWLKLAAKNGHLAAEIRLAEILSKEQNRRPAGDCVNGS
ncbi:MAG: SEL1-like repeat protein [Smithellaceae bacterium]|nr:SEL1-like repeat protein [Smithellaceae bacterium]